MALAGCVLVPSPAALLEPRDCFGTVPYEFDGWTTLAAIRQGEDATGPIYALITRDDVVLTVSPPAPDGSTVSLIGRGVCWTSAGGGMTSKAAFGPTRQERNPGSN